MKQFVNYGHETLIYLYAVNFFIVNKVTVAFFCFVYFLIILTYKLKTIMKIIVLNYKESTVGIHILNIKFNPCIIVFNMTTDTDNEKSCARMLI